MMKRSFMKRFLILGLAVTLIFTLASCGKNDEKADSTDMSGTVSSVKEDGQENKFRKFDLNDFADVAPRRIVFYNYGQNFESVTGYYDIVHKEGILNAVTKSADSQISFIEKYFPEYVFGAESDDCLELEYVDQYNSYLYFKVHLLKNGDVLIQDCCYWKTTDEVYLIVKGGFNNSDPNEQLLDFTYCFRNFNEELNISRNVKDRLIETEYYSIELPESWIGKCHFSLYKSDYGEIFCDFWTGDRSEDGLYIASLCLFPESMDYKELRKYKLLGKLSANNEIYNVIIADSVGEKEDWVQTMTDEFYTAVITSIQSPGHTLELYGENPDSFVSDDIPSISVWSDYLGKTFSPKSTYMDVTRSCLSADGTANSAGVGSIYGAYAKSNVNYYWVDDGRNFRYYGVQNGTIVAYMDEVSDFNRNVRYYASDACLTVAPKIVTDGNWNYCMWELENGYIVMKVVKTASSYANWIVYTVAHFKDRDMCFWLSPNIEELIADRTAKMAEQERREQQEEQELSESKRKAEEEANALAEKRVKKELQQLIDNQYSDYVRIGETANGSINSYWVKVLSADKKQITLRIWNDTRLYDTPIDQTVKLTILSISNRPYSLSDASKIVEAGFANDISGYYECYLEHSPFRAEINAMDSNGNKGYQILIEENAITLNGFDPIKDKLGGIDFTNSPRYYY